MQKTVKKTRSTKKEQVDEVQETEVASTNEVSEEAACCLLAIDEVLEENDSRELTDEEIYAKGKPYFDGDAIAEMYRDGELTEDEYDAAWEKGYADYRADMERYAQAYENITGSKLDRCVCG